MNPVRTGLPLPRPPPAALAILECLRRNGFTAFLCGGCVRDALLGAEPKDFDIATSAVPERVESLFSRTVPVGRAFGVMLVDGGDGEFREVAAFRTESGYADGRRPDRVAFSTPEEDAKRRDFTMNALFCDPFAGQILDYVGGVSDIEKRLLRTVGDPGERFREDRLRLLRAVRFAARTGFSLDPALRLALAEMSGLAASVAPERLAAELEGMLLGGASRPAFSLLRESGLLKAVLPELDALAGVEQPPDFHPEGDVWRHTLLLLGENDMASSGSGGPERIPDRSHPAPGMDGGEFSLEEYRSGIAECRAAMDRDQESVLAWSGLLHDIGKPGSFTRSDRIRFHDHDRLGAEMAAALLERLRRPRRLVDGVGDLIRRHIHFASLRRMRRSKLRRWLGERNFPLHLELHRLDCAASHRKLGNWFFGLESWREDKKLPPPAEPLLRGEDVIALGMAPGPGIGRLLRLVEDARLEGRLSSRAEALAYAQSVVGNQSPSGPASLRPPLW